MTEVSTGGTTFQLHVKLRLKRVGADPAVFAFRVVLMASVTELMMFKPM
jgi:hypothetical protein